MTTFEQHHIDLDQLGDLIDGRLAPEERQRVEAHVAICSACSERRERLETLVRAARALPDEIDPPATLWNEVRARIAPAPSRARQRWMLAAAAVILVALSSGVTALLLRRPVIVIRPMQPPIVNATLPAPVRSVDADYSSAIADLNETLAERR